jgi:KDO2-lipid IV(A) lauroyltransferase
MLIATFRLLARLPLRVLFAIGAVSGQLVYWLSPTYRRRMRANLAQAGFDAERMAGPAAREVGRQALESAWVWLRPADDLRRVLSRVGGEIEDDALATGGPVIYLTAHLGCFEVCAKHCILGHWGPPRMFTALYRIPKQAALGPLVELGRTLHGGQLVPANLSGVRGLLRTLKQGNAVGILPDQVPSAGDGVWAPFFGRPAYTMTLPARLAAATGATVLLFFGERVHDADGKGPGYRIHFARPPEPLNGDAAHDAAVINRGLEELIRRCPEQYLWGYNRYKVPAGVAPPDESGAQAAQPVLER